MPTDDSETTPENPTVTPTIHTTVMLDETVDGLAVKPGAVVVDGTMGGGGHLRKLAELAGPTGRVVGVDRDPMALERVEQAWDGPKTLRLCQANFEAIPEVLEQLDWGKADAVCLDLGLSSDQLADRERGFSFESDGPLDLRFDIEEGQPAWRLLEILPEKRLADLIYQNGEERCSRKIARRIVERRRNEPIRTAVELADLVRRCVPPGGNIHPATRTFQALRIAVNDELGSLQRILTRLPEVLAPGGRIAIISFHSLEDRQVKEAFRDDDRYIVLTKKPIRPNEAEIARNPRSRSAKLRIAERAPA